MPLLTPEEEREQSAIEVYKSLCRSITNKKLYGDTHLSDFTLAELEELRDEAFRMIEMNTVDHILAVHELKKELNLF